MIACLKRYNIDRFHWEKTDSQIILQNVLILFFFIKKTSMYFNVPIYAFIFTIWDETVWN